MALLSKHYRRFVRNGAKLQGAAKERLAAIDQELSSLSVRFGQNVLAETNQYVLILRDPAELEGLTEEQVASAADAAKQRGLEKAWVFTVHKPSMIPFLQNSTHRHLRQQLFTAYVERGNRANEYDNNAIAAKMAALRAERAKLLGFESHAHYQLSENMAKTPEEVYGLLHQLWKPALAKAKEEASLLTAMLKADHPTADLQPWDWWYYAEKVKKRDYDLNENDLKPYFSLDMVRQGAFDVATQLFGIRFKERTDLPVYHPEVQVFEVLEANGDHIGLLTTDYFPRASKRGGAWMNALRKQMKKEGKMITPIISNVGNFSRPVGDQPALLTFEEVLTLFHEFGHALHGLLSKGTYPTFTGTSVARDFVELPSQIMENWAAHPDVIRTYAKHWKTGEVIPDELLTKMDKAGKFNQGFATTEYLAACFLDMDWHTLTDTTPQQVATFEKASMAKIGLIPEIVVRYRTPYFGHIFAGGYSSGYYGYVWAEVLDADAFEAFRQKGLFDPTLATAFREHILSAGGVREAMDAYQAFRGQKPTIEPLLKKRGLN
jgi:peptidyl-dipeptidase Dcp